MLKKILSILTIIFILSSFIVEKVSANNKTYFRITAYYSPLPNQSHYIKWNYNAEIIMNWRWIRWTSWKRVFSGMLAAPSKYSFWTKIQLKWLWVAEVADRWWAIVKSGERNFKYDRIDIWCGYWEKWLQRAMFWGNRVIEWKVVSRNSKVNLNINNIPAPRWTLNHATQNPEYLKTWKVKNKVYLNSKENKNNSPIIPFHKGDENNIFSWPIQNSTWVKKLQKILKEMKLYSWEVNWKYITIRKIILKFQLKNKIISKNNERWAGNFWPKTRKTLKQKYTEFKEQIKKEAEEKKKKQEKEEKARKLATKRINSIWDIKFWDISYDVRMCQKALKEVWYFNYKDTAIFWEKTKQSIINYQLDRKLIKNKNIYWAGIFWPKTRKSLIKDLSKLK